MSGHRHARLIDAWDRIERCLIGALALVSLLLSFYSMISRYVAPELALDWTSDVAVYLITWAFFLAAARAVAGADHVRADVIASLLPPDASRYLGVLQDLISLLFCLVVVVGGAQVVELSLRFGERSDTSLAMPMWMYYGCLPIAFASIALRYTVRLAKSVRALGSGHAGPAIDTHAE